ncbi:hypothetical protein JMJ35_006150 [Cladonia borealis]|uniref:Uncharacterized protein n=1 Tax=Cladonia borealis TaxID=184061 RepID=A0AA39QYH9_9LECA|nr:hypothetical protein JMJ35_006150 [Cladonia borealis]
MNLLFLMLLFILTLLGVANSAPVATPTTGATPTASMTGNAASATYLPDTSIINSLQLTDPATWVELAIIWIGFLIGFLQAYFIYYLLTGAASRRRGRSSFPNTDDSAGQNPQRQSRKGPRRLCLFEWGMTRQDYDAYFWDPEGYGRRRYEEQEKQNLHNILLRYFRRWFRLKSHRKRERTAPGAARSVATFRVRRHRHPCELTSTNDPNVLNQPNSDPAAFLSEASEEPYHLAQSPFDTTRRRNVTGHRAQPWNSYSRASRQEAATTAREWSPNTTDYYDALDNAEVVDRTVYKRACTAPIPVMPPETENAIRAASEGSYLPKGHYGNLSNVAMSSHSANEYDAEDYEAGASIDLEISSCGSSNETTVWPTIRANHSQVMSNALSEQFQVASKASRISQVPEFNPSAAYVLPKTRYPAAKPSISCTERNPTEKSS